MPLQLLNIEWLDQQRAPCPRADVSHPVPNVSGDEHRPMREVRLMGRHCRQHDVASPIRNAIVDDCTVDMLVGHDPDCGVPGLCRQDDVPPPTEQEGEAPEN
jgi:hypothetical protein